MGERAERARPRVLLDEGIPERLRRLFSSAVAVETVRYRGWKGLRNGDLPRTAEPHFDVLLTVDKGLRHQQDVAALDLAVVLLDAGGTTLAALAPLVPTAEVAIREVRPGAVVVVTG